jgi:predicted lipoprotein with Yx(FWY)xxD motif
MKKLSISIAIVALALLGLAGCTTPDAGTDTGNGSDTSETPDTGDTGDTADSEGISSLTTAESDLGTIVVDDAGMTVYVFDQDEPGSGESTCSGPCLANWPPVTAGEELPALDGVTGEVETITGTDGSTQVTLNGWPLYYYVGDQAAGDTTGQAVQDVWWVIGPDGERITG